MDVKAQEETQEYCLAQLFFVWMGWMGEYYVHFKQYALSCNCLFIVSSTPLSDVCWCEWCHLENRLLTCLEFSPVGYISGRGD